MHQIQEIEWIEEAKACENKPIETFSNPKSGFHWGEWLYHKFDSQGSPHGCWLQSNWSFYCDF